MVETVKDTSAAIQQDKTNIAEKVNEILTSFTGNKAELIPILQQIQQVFGYLPEDAMSQIADFVNVPECSIYGVATFYAQFKFTPVGRNVIKVCRGTGCYVKGAPRLLDEIEARLGIKDGETTPDMEYTLETVACFGSCALAPVMVVNDRVYGNVTVEKVREILGSRE
ncbi:MAG: NADH-quinone oxidoreductase subunit NuoE [Dehalococcoidia bacterium]|jgi:NADH-quinone oxidoreductase subunit E